MSRHYERKSIKSQRGQGLSALWLSFVTFVFGYLAASWVDVNQLSRWISAHIHASQPAAASLQVEAKVEALPHPKLEFYTLLANEQVNHSKVEVKAEPELATINLSEHAVPSMPPVHEAKSPSLSEPVHMAAVEEAMPVEVVKKAEPHRPAVATVLPKATGSYSIQVGSFRAYTEAQRMKSKLMMKGFSVSIVTVNQQTTYWYRVFIGPFGSLTQAQQAQMAFARQEHITGMIRKVA